VTIGTRRAGNQAGMIRSTEMNVMASPAPTMTRASTAGPGWVASARDAWPTAISTAPAAISSREPKRSTSTPTGICMAA
jgi:hypothetical protein